MKQRFHAIILGLLLTALLVVPTAAQWNVTRFDSNPNRIYATFGLDPAFFPAVGYARVTSIFGHRVQVAGDVGIVAAEVDTRDFRARLHFLTSFVSWRSLHLTGSTALIARGTDNSIYRGYNFGTDLTGALGLYRRGWFVAAEFGIDKAGITHIKHSDWYRTYFYADAQDGWYRDPGGTIHYGLSAGVTVGNAELLARFGQLCTEEFNELTPPMYASIGLGFAF
jgi:hypothetical protein